MTVLHGTVAIAANLVAAWWQPLVIAGSIGLTVRWAYTRACTWADRTLADVPWIVEQPIREIAPDSDHLWAEFRDEEAWAQIERVLNIVPQQREPGSES